MATVQEIREGVFVVSWSNPTYTTTGQATINIEEISESCQLSYTVNGATTTLTMELKSIPSTKVKNPHVTEPSSVMAIKYGSKLPMVYNDSKWQATFQSTYVCCGRLGLVFDIVIDFIPKKVSLMKVKEKRVLHHILNLWNTKLLADVTFKFKEREIKAHTLIIASGSPVIAAMFQNDFKEKQDRVVVIKDVEASVFEEFLRFIYTGDADWDNVDASELLVVAEKYGVDSLKEECALHLAENLTVENATKLLVMSHLNNSTYLYEATLGFMSKNAKAICSRKEWMEVIKEYPELSFVAMQIMVMG